jgi:hypothetical protein
MKRGEVIWPPIEAVKEILGIAARVKRRKFRRVQKAVAIDRIQCQEIGDRSGAGRQGETRSGSRE